MIMDKKAKKGSMQFFKKKTSRNRKLKSKAPSSFDDVSVDVFECIIDHLPRPSIALLALTCRGFASVLGGRCFRKREFFSSDDEYDAFLELLCIHSLDIIACFDCHRLHTLEKYCLPGHLHNSSRNPEQKMRYMSPKWERTMGPSLTHAKMAIKSYHQDPKSTKILDLISDAGAVIRRARRAFGRPPSLELLELTRQKFRMVKGSLIHRRQFVWISLSTFSCDVFDVWPPSAYREVSINDTEASMPGNIFICAHIRLLPVLTLIPRGRCSICRTEFCSGYEDYNVRGLAFFITIWKDLGSKPGNEVWQQHLPFAPFATIDDESFWVIQGGPRLKELSSAFENGKTYRFDSLMTHDNQYEMFRQQKILWQPYAMYRVIPNGWSIRCATPPDLRTATRSEHFLSSMKRKLKPKKAQAPEVLIES